MDSFPPPSKVMLSGFMVWVLLSAWDVAVGQLHADSSPMDEAERDALFSAIRGFVGDGWNGSDLYPDPCGWTPIQGVSCDLYNGLWYITALTVGPVHDNSLVCSENPVFAPQLFELARLKSLSLYSCFVQQKADPVSIPLRGWERIVDTIESLEFRSNPGLVGQLPSGISLLQRLDSLVVLDNGLNGDLPSSLTNLTRLRRLVLSWNSFTGSIPSEYGRLTELLILDLSGNSLSGPLPPSLGNLTSLLKLDLSNNRRLSGHLPEQLNNLRNLTLLDLRDNNLTGGLPRTTFEGMVSLKGMLLSNNPLGGGLEDIAWENLKRLEILDLDNLRLTGTIPKSISCLESLRYLGLGNNNLTGTLPADEISSLSGINTVHVNGNDLIGELKFPEWFYRKLGARFSAWNNPNLCYPTELTSKGVQPNGVSPCRSPDSGEEEINGNSKARLDDRDGEVGWSSSNSRSKPDDAPSSSSGSLSYLGYYTRELEVVVMLGLALVVLWEW
ncbi:hypothetical protein MLD38_004375 [Melastoma candidum]|uniref:Uncharacterized protein n=1 Tax=Melastoma candidum TaxID=119954 RepID=A0ACB9S5M1_9MYRT|nr:hypothetical protein MLD38_004375 [Melastoma candidum]